MAKIQELSDQQLKQVMIRYRNQMQVEKDATKKKKIAIVFRQLQVELARREGKGEEQSKPKAEPEVSSTAATMRMPKAQASKKASAKQKKQSQKKPKRKTSPTEPKKPIPRIYGNVTLVIGLLMGVFGLYLTVDYYFLEMHWQLSQNWWLWLLPALPLAKLGSFLIEMSVPKTGGEEQMQEL